VATDKGNLGVFDIKDEKFIVNNFLASKTQI
jgi:hypothetical protein